VKVKWCRTRRTTNPALTKRLACRPRQPLGAEKVRGDPSGDVAETSANSGKAAGVPSVQLRVGRRGAVEVRGLEEGGTPLLRCTPRLRADGSGRSRRATVLDASALELLASLTKMRLARHATPARLARTSRSRPRQVRSPDLQGPEVRIGAEGASSPSESRLAIHAAPAKRCAVRETAGSTLSACRPGVVPGAVAGRRGPWNPPAVTRPGCRSGTTPPNSAGTKFPIPPRRWVELVDRGRPERRLQVGVTHGRARRRRPLRGSQD